MSLVHRPVKKIYFIGICGTAMASLAVLLKKRGYRVKGSDQNIYPPMSTFLQQHDVPILDGFQEAHLQDSQDLVVIGNTLSRGNPEVEKVLESGTLYVSMPELLREFFIRGKTSLVVTGTHGKTTTASLLTWIFECAGRNPGFFIGGIPENFGTSCREAKGEFFITEGDEYDTVFYDKRSKFFHYQPHQLLVNNIEYDHADIFASLEEILRAFRLLLRLVPRNGLVVVNGDDENAMGIMNSRHSPWISFGLGEKCHVKATNLRATSGGTAFSLKWPGRCEGELHIPLFGEFNVRNAVGALVLALYNGIALEEVQKAFNRFSNVRRRQELRGIRRGVYVYDDFAHHPTAVRETLKALRQKHPHQRLIAVFEPRSNTSVLKIHQSRLIASFEQADEVLLAYPYRMEQIPNGERLDVEAIVSSIRQKGKKAAAFHKPAQIIEHLRQHTQDGDVVLVMSNGKFGNIHQSLLETL